MQKSTKELIQYQLIDLHYEKMQVFRDIMTEYGADTPEWAFTVGYLAGLIDGKRGDRARRAKGNKAQTAKKGGAEQWEQQPARPCEKYTPSKAPAPANAPELGAK